MRYTKRNIEDWDFRNCYPDSPTHDSAASLFFGSHYTDAYAVSLARAEVMNALVEYGFGAVEEDREHVRLVKGGDKYLAGFKSAESRFTREGRFYRRVIQSLRRENRKYGHLRLNIMPPLPPGFRSKRTTAAPEDS